MDIEQFVSRLDGAQRTSRGYKARCPAHQDKSPSLSIRETDTLILLHCFAGCKSTAIVSALGLEMRDLFLDSSAPSNSVHAPQKLDLLAVTFRFELGALDRRIRAERVLNAAQNFHPKDLSDQQLDRVLTVIAGAYADQDRAEFLEVVADDMRVRAYRERTERHAA